MHSKFLNGATDGSLRKWIFLNLPSFLFHFTGKQNGIMARNTGGVYMIIQSSNVAMASRRSYSRTTAVSSSLTSWGSGFMKKRNIQMVQHYSEESDSGRGKYPDTGTGSDLFNQFKQAQSIGSPVSITKRQTPDAHSIKAQSINYLLMILFGKNGNPRDSFISSITGQPSMSQTSGGTYVEYGYQYEEEETTFSTKGTVKTADGREIDFNLSMTMSRSFEEEYAGSVNFGAALNQAALCDPLVINLNSTSAQVSDQKFYFDLDADGTLDEISNLAAGSGFLALDLNGDGKINDGSELFGTKSGDGFADLAKYDSDGNGWIDENDPIFDKLRIWTKDSSGKDVLCAIGKAGIGAIYLGNAQTDFALNSKQDNSTNALVRKTGIFLYENGSCGTVQHLDMAKSSGRTFQYNRTR